jgi:hypothetical protein
MSFEDPDGTSAQALLRGRTLYMLGHVVTVKRWKQSPPKRVSYKPSTTVFGASKVAPSTSGVAQAAPPSPTLNPSSPMATGSQLSYSFSQTAEEARETIARNQTAKAAAMAAKLSANQARRGA